MLLFDGERSRTRDGATSCSARVLAYSTLALSMALTACGPPSVWRGRSSGDPTCEAVCDYYTSCRRTEDKTIYAACVLECRDIYYEDGQPDATSLQYFQQLECNQAIAFVEGKSGRPPGVSGAGSVVSTGDAL